MTKRASYTHRASIDQTDWEAYYRCYMCCRPIFNIDADNARDSYRTLSTWMFNQCEQCRLSNAAAIPPIGLYDLFNEDYEF